MGLHKFSLLLAVLLLNFCRVSGQCSNSNRTTYLRSEGYELQSVTQATINNVALADCAQRCNEGISGVCEAFHYDTALRNCMLSGDAVQPFGSAVAANVARRTIAIYQRICIPSMMLCSAEFSFERLPQSVLVGFAAETFVSASLSECLRKCLEAPVIYRIECKSALYFYETSECVLNREDRHNRPDLFSEDTQGFIVDYFENNCLGATCAATETSEYLLSEDVALTGTPGALFDADAVKCRQLCDANEAAGLEFPCKAYVLDELRHTCQLLNQRSLPRGTITLTQKLGSSYYEKFCLAAVHKCANPAFIRVPGHVLVGFADEIRETPNLAECLDFCLEADGVDGFQCRSVMYYYDKAECILNAENRFTQARLFSGDTIGYQVDYFDNTCGNGDVLPSSGPATDTPAPASTTPTTAPTATTTQFQFTTETPTQTTPTTMGALSTECRFDGIHVKTSFSRPIRGSIFVKNKFSTCRTEFDNSREAELLVSFPTDSIKKYEFEQKPVTKDCGGEEVAPGVFSYIFVVQRNELGVPGLLTSTDRLFNITCDYSNDANRKVTAVGAATVNGFPSAKTIFGSGTADIQPNIRMVILRDAQPVSNVLLGEQLDLKWQIEDPVPDEMGFFIRECVAERMGGNPPQPEPVQLVLDGCPDEAIIGRLMNEPITAVFDGFLTKITMFRFDGSRSVRIRCTIDMCHGPCNPTTCLMSSESRQSMGKRKKRQLGNFQSLLLEANLGETPDNQSADVVKKETVNGMFTIVDDLAAAQRKSKLLQERRERADYLHGEKKQNGARVVLRSGRRVCVARPVFIVLLALLALLCSLEVAVLFAYFWSRHPAGMEGDLASESSGASPPPTVSSRGGGGGGGDTLLRQFMGGLRTVTRPRVICVADQPSSLSGESGRSATPQSDKQLFSSPKTSAHERMTSGCKDRTAVKTTDLNAITHGRPRKAAKTESDNLRELDRWTHDKRIKGHYKGEQLRDRSNLRDLAQEVHLRSRAV